MYAITSTSFMDLILKNFYFKGHSLENVSVVSSLTMELNKSIIFCYQKKPDFALKLLNESLQKTSGYERLQARFKVLISKIQEKILVKKNEIDMSYIPANLVSQAAKQGFGQEIKIV